MIVSLKNQQVRRAFNAATNTYDSAADWQKNVGNVLMQYIDEIKPCRKTILDLGSGTGYLTHHMQTYHPNNQFITLDIAEKMLHFSKQHINRNVFICSDAENLALKDKSIDMVVSNMVLHWCHSFKKALEEQYRILTKNGILIFSVLGPHSLQALKIAWKHFDQNSHVNTFPDAKTIREACDASRFSLLRFEHHEIEKYYENVYELMNHLKATGAKNITENKPKGLMGKQKMKQLNNQYRNPLIYEVFTVICQK